VCVKFLDFRLVGKIDKIMIFLIMLKNFDIYFLDRKFIIGKQLVILQKGKVQINPLKYSKTT
jgi:hypothetical protein